MANDPNFERAIVETLGTWLATVGNATPYSLGLLQVTTEWSEANTKRVYPEAEIEQVSFTADECAPFAVEDLDATVGAGKALFCYGQVKATLKIDFWCAGKKQRSAIESGLQLAFHGDVGRPGLHLYPTIYWKVPVGYTLTDKQRLDTDDDRKRGIYRLVVELEAETSIVREQTAPAVKLDPRFIVDNDTANPALAAAATTLNTDIPSETVPAVGEPIPHPFNNA